MIMAILKMKKIRELNEKEAPEKLREIRLEPFKDSGAKSIGGNVKSPGRIREMRKTIARFKTIKKKRGNMAIDFPKERV